MNRNEVAREVIETFRKVFPSQADIREDSTADDIAYWDSLNHIILIQELEKSFGLQFNLFDIIEIRNVGGFIDLISIMKGHEIR